MLRRWAARRAAKVELRHWNSVRHILEFGERPIDYLNVVAPRAKGLGGIVWLTDRRIFWTSVEYDGHTQIYHGGQPLSEIETVDLSDNGQGLVIVFREHVDGRPGVGFGLRWEVPRPLVLLFIRECQQTIALCTGDSGS